MREINDRALSEGWRRGNRRLGKPFLYCSLEFCVRRTGRKQGLGRKSSDSPVVLKGVGPGWWGVLEPGCLSKDSHVVQEWASKCNPYFAKPELSSCQGPSMPCTQEEPKLWRLHNYLKGNFIVIKFSRDKVEALYRSVILTFTKPCFVSFNTFNFVKKLPPPGIP